MVGGGFDAAAGDVVGAAQLCRAQHGLGADGGAEGVDAASGFDGVDGGREFVGAAHGFGDAVDQVLGAEGLHGLVGGPAHAGAGADGIRGAACSRAAVAAESGEGFTGQFRCGGALVVGQNRDDAVA